MSKKLVKILSICAFAVLIPMIILGVALTVTEAKGITLSIFEGGTQGGEGTSSSIAIYIDNQKQDQTTVTTKKGTEVTVTWEGTGYDFCGWYEGNVAEVQGKTAKSADASYTFVLNNNTTLTAIKDVISLTLNVKYHANSEEVTPVTYSETNGFSQYRTRDGYKLNGFKYGDTLYEFNAETNDYAYNGSSLGRELVNANVREADVTAVWTCNHPVLKFEINGSYESNTVYGKTGDTSKALGYIESILIQDEPFSSFKYFDLTDKFTDLLGYDSFYYNNGSEDIAVKLPANMTLSVILNDTGSNMLIGLSADSTFADFINKLETALGGSKVLPTDKINVLFTFELA